MMGFFQMQKGSAPKAKKIKHPSKVLEKREF